MTAQNFTALDSTGKRTNLFALLASAGAGSSGKLPALDATGRLDGSFMPVGVEIETVSVLTSEILAGGAFVNIWNNSGTPNARNADNGTPGKEANGFVLAGFGSAVPATVYLNGPNTALSALTTGSRYYLGVAGAATLTPPDPTNIANAGKFIQFLGEAFATTAINTIFPPADYL